MTVKDFIHVTNVEIDRSNATRPFAICKDGLVVSIQASHFHYCIPKTLPNKLEANTFDYEYVEVGFQNHMHIPEWDDKYDRQDWKNPNPDAINCLYGFVPIQDLEEFVEKHGGITIIDRRTMLL